MEYHLDYETKAVVPLGGKKSVGSFRYANDPSCRILCAAVARGDEEPVIWSCLASPAENQPALNLLREMVSDPENLIFSHNALFEAAVSTALFEETFGLPCPRPEQWRCTMAMARRAGLPASLEKCAEALRLTNQKDKRGSDLIQLFSVPQPKDNKKLGKKAGEFMLPEENPAAFKEFCDYCLQDVRVEKEIHQKLKTFELKGFSLQSYQLDLDINLRGFPVNLKALHAALKIVKEEITKVDAEFHELTGFRPTQRERVLEWFQARGFPGKNMKKETMEEIFENVEFDSSTPLGRAMNLRKQASFASLKKIPSMILCAGPHDNRVRGTLNYHGAGTGRWTANLVQPQNFKKPSKHLEKLTDAIYHDIIDGANAAYLSLVYGPPLECISSAIRHFIHDSDGPFFDADYSAIEARIIAWQAQEQWRLDFLNKDGRIYEASASKMFGVPLSEFEVYKKLNGQHHPLRAKGKVTELSCIAEGQLVTTDHGLVPIQNVTEKMRVWDGKEFVSHGGVVYQGIKDTMEYEGLTATEDHVVFTEAGEMQLKQAASTRTPLLKSNPSGADLRMGYDHIARSFVQRAVATLLCADEMQQLRQDLLAISGQPNTRFIERLPTLLSAPEGSLMAEPEADGSTSTLHESPGPRLPQLRGTRDSVPFRVNHGSLSMGDGKPGAASRYGAGSDRQRAALRTRESSIRDSSAELYQPEEKQTEGDPIGRYELEPFCEADYSQVSAYGQDPRRNYPTSATGSSYAPEELAGYRGESQKARTYDILNCGPRNRFVVSGVLVHNCGFMGWVGALIRMGALREGLTKEELPDLIRAWRDANPAIVQFWADIEQAAKSAIRSPGRFPFGVGCEMFCAETGGIRFLFMRLPSGRRIAYPWPKMSQQLRWKTINAEGEETNHKLISPTVEQIQAARRDDPKAKLAETITYWGEIKDGVWGRISTYAGSLTNNCVQGIAADVMSVGANNAKQAGFQIVALVHDQAIAHYDSTKTIEQFIELLTDMPPWADGLPLKAAGGVIPFYRKD